MYMPGMIWFPQNSSAPEGFKIAFRRYGYALCLRSIGEDFPINEELALLLSTSGSTGSIKYVRQSYKNIMVNTESIITALEIKKSDRAMVMLPLTYTYGLSIVNTYLKVGATLLIPSKGILNTSFWNFARKVHCTSICGVPVTYDYLRMVKFAWSSVPSITLATQAGGKLSAMTEEYMCDCAESNHFDFAVMYGQTEATARISCHFLNRNPEKKGSVGRVVKGGKVTIEDGEIVYHGENVSMGYACDYKDLALGDVNNETLHTGDLGYMDEEGYIYVTGRMKRIAKVNGVRISLDELESIIEEKYDYSCMCIERDDIIHIFLEADNIDDSYVLYLSRDLSNQLKINIRNISINLVDKIPRLVNGKKDYKLI